jgi:SAM-dependent methyltransferase
MRCRSDAHALPAVCLRKRHGSRFQSERLRGCFFVKLIKLMPESRLGGTYRIIYDKVCGRHPNLRLWHFQSLDAYYLYRSLKRLLPTFGGRLLDAVCGTKPYHDWFGPVTEYVGLDVSAGPAVDLVVASNERWPLPNENLDVILSGQVLEHVEHLDITLKEMSRVLKRGAWQY